MNDIRQYHYMFRYLYVTLVLLLQVSITTIVNYGVNDVNINKQSHIVCCESVVQQHDPLQKYPRP